MLQLQLAVCARCADEILFRQRLFHLVDDVRLGRHDQRVTFKFLREFQDAAG